MSPAVNVTLEEVPFAILETVKARILANRQKLEAGRRRPSTRPRPQFRRYGASERGWRKPQHGAGAGTTSSLGLVELFWYEPVIATLPWPTYPPPLVFVGPTDDPSIRISEVPNVLLSVGTSQVSSFFGYTDSQYPANGSIFNRVYTLGSYYYGEILEKARNANAVDKRIVRYFLVDLTRGPLATGSEQANYPADGAFNFRLWTYHRVIDLYVSTFQRQGFVLNPETQCFPQTKGGTICYPSYLDINRGPYSFAVPVQINLYHLNDIGEEEGFDFSNSTTVFDEIVRLRDAAIDLSQVKTKSTSVTIAETDTTQLNYSAETTLATITVNEDAESYELA